MKKLHDQLKDVAKMLAKLSKQVDRITAQVKKLDQPKKKATRVAPKRKAVKKAAPRKRAVKKAAVKKAAPKRRAAAKSVTVLDTVFNVIKRTRKGVSIATLKEKTKLNPRQLSNALYKLSKRGTIVAKSRGVYIKA